MLAPKNVIASHLQFLPKSKRMRRAHHQDSNKNEEGRPSE